MKKMPLYLIAISVAVGLVFLWAHPVGFLRRGDFQKLRIGSAAFEVEISNTPAARMLGLSGREYLASNKGMLFLFPFSATQVFWMKDMHFPIDIIWIKDKKVVGMAIGAEPPATGTAEADLEKFTSPEPVDAVLEINAGLTMRLGIKVGDTVAF